MTEPFYVAETWDSEHFASYETVQAWFQARLNEARERGGTHSETRVWPRFTISEDGTGLLIECWKERPADQGLPRWKNSETEHGTEAMTEHEVDRLLAVAIRTAAAKVRETARHEVTFERAGLLYAATCLEALTPAEVRLADDLETNHGG